ncbi:unnamed protein product [Closterium sp. NIES-64]|nr:unnamed protein product [Closterium sp. NIES-64]
MATLNVLAFDPDGRPIEFATWLDDLQLFLMTDAKDGVSLFDYASGTFVAPADTAAALDHSQWQTRDATTRLAIRNYLPITERAHFSQHKTAKALYEAVVARYSSPATAPIGRLMLPYLFPDLSSFTTAEDLISHLRSSDARFRAALSDEFLAENHPPMYFTLYFLVTRLPDTLRSVRDHFLALDPTTLTVADFEKHLLTAEKNILAVGATRGTPRTPLFEGCSPSPLVPSYASAAAALDYLGAEEVGAASAPSGKRHSARGNRGGRGGGGGGGGGGSGGGGGGGGGAGGRGGGGGGGGGGGTGSSGGGSGGSGGGGSGSGSGGGGWSGTGQKGSSSVLTRSTTVLSCPAVPSGELSGLHLPSFSTNLVSNAVLQDHWVDTFTPGGQRVAICTCSRTGRHLATFTRAFGSISGLPRSLPSLPPSPAPPCIPCVEGRQRATPHSSSFPPTEAPLQTLHLDVWGPARVRGQGHERYFLLVVDEYTRYTTVFPLQRKGDVPDVLIPWIRGVRLQLREQFESEFPVLCLHSERGGEFSSGLLPAYFMEVARTSMIYAAAPHFLWPFAVRYAVHQLNLCPCVSVPETLPTLRWTGEVGDASRFRVWGARAFVRDTTADKLSPRAIPCVFLGFLPDAPGWQFYDPASRCVFTSQDVTFDESVPFYRLFPYRSAPLPPPPAALSRSRSSPGPLLALEVLQLLEVLKLVEVLALEALELLELLEVLVLEVLALEVLELLEVLALEARELEVLELPVALHSRDRSSLRRHLRLCHCLSPCFVRP